MGLKRLEPKATQKGQGPAKLGPPVEQNRFQDGTVTARERKKKNKAQSIKMSRQEHYIAKVIIPLTKCAD
jgi:hypothetical protein